MAGKTCFVVMAIGNQSYGGQDVTAADLKDKYDNLIKEAILKARPSLEVVRADEVSVPGTITTDIITRIMHSDYVVADVTYPNPNVFYELGLRHACKAGTIIIRDKSVPSVPFDISHLRHIEYENTTAGLKGLATHLSTYLSHFDAHPERPDNHFLELAKLTGYTFPNYKKGEEAPLELQAIMGVMQSPELLRLLTRQQQGEEIDQMEVLNMMMSNPQIAQPFLKGMIQSGQISFDPKPKKPVRRRK